jgi:hypothetical protein
MSAKQNSKGRWGRAVAHVGIVGAYLALGTACSGSIEETDVDRARLERASTGTTPAPQAPAAPAPRPTTTTPPTGGQTASTPPASTPPASTPPPAPPEDADPPPAASGDISFEADIYPILSDACAPCHAASAIAGVSIADTDVATAFESASERQDRLIARISDGSRPMPPAPGCEGPPGSGGDCLTVEQFEKLEAWVEAGAPE